MIEQQGSISLKVVFKDLIFMGLQKYIHKERVVHARFDLALQETRATNC